MICIYIDIFLCCFIYAYLNISCVCLSVGRTVGRSGRQMDGQSGGRTDSQSGGRAVGPTDGRSVGRSGERQVVGRAGGRTVGQSVERSGGSRWAQGTHAETYMGPMLDLHASHLDQSGHLRRTHSGTMRSHQAPWPPPILWCILIVEIRHNCQYAG